MKERTKEELEKEIRRVTKRIKGISLDMYLTNEKIKQVNYNILINRYNFKRRRINELKMKYDVLAKEYNEIYGEKYKLYNLPSIRPLKPRTKFYNKLTKKPLAN